MEKMLKTILLIGGIAFVINIAYQGAQEQRNAPAPDPDRLDKQQLVEICWSAVRAQNPDKKPLKPRVDQYIHGSSKNSAYIGLTATILDNGPHIHQWVCRIADGKIESFWLDAINGQTQ